jgi:predicted LPLAT superfamily acyltransferase
MTAPPADGPAAVRTGGAPWASAPERGSATLVRAMMFLALNVGRPVARSILYLIAAYFFAFAPAARRGSRAYLRRALGHEPGARERFRQVFAFASTILDRLYLVTDRYDCLEISTEGDALMLDTLERGKGAFLLGAHLGSFEIMGAVGRQHPGLRVAMAMYERPNRLTTLIRAAAPADAPEIIPLGRVEAMLRIRDCLEEGKFVGMLADRAIGDTAAQSVSFLGRAALFPSGPMRAAAALRRPVIFMTGLYRGGNRYHVVFRQIADFSQPAAPGSREAAVRAAILRYVAVLEEYCRSDPYNWFNFYDFWRRPDASADSAGGAAA